VKAVGLAEPHGDDNDAVKVENNGRPRSAARSSIAAPGNPALQELIIRPKQTGNTGGAIMTIGNTSRRKCRNMNRDAHGRTATSAKASFTNGTNDRACLRFISCFTRRADGTALPENHGAAAAHRYSFLQLDSLS
jgi:hypothetical protein